MEKEQMAFEERKERSIRRARARGIADIVQGEDDAVSLETLDYASMLTDKHAPDLYKKLEERRKTQV